MSIQRGADIDFRWRVAPRDLPELMDGECSYEEFHGCLRSLEQINRWLLGYRPTLNWLGKLVSDRRSESPVAKCEGPGAPACFFSDQPVHILDVGSGGGDLLRRIARWARRRGIAVQLTGIDLNPHAARAAAERTPKEDGVEWVTGDALAYRPEKPVDIVVSSLTAHHLEDEEIVRLLQWMEASARGGWFLNDLERSARSARMIGWMARVFGWHRFVRHDGPASFRRALRREDWERLLRSAEIPREAVTVERWRPGRLCVGRWK